MVDDTKAADRPVDEIEITDEMVEAGIDVYGLFVPSEDSAADIVCSVYEAMRLAREDGEAAHGRRDRNPAP